MGEKNVFTSSSAATIPGRTSTCMPICAELETAVSVNAAIFPTAELSSLLAVMGADSEVVQQLCQAAGISAEELAQATRRLPFRNFADAYQVALAQFGATLPLHAGRDLHLTAFGIPGLALLSNATLLDAIRQLQQWWPLFGLKFDLMLTQEQRTVCIQLRPRFAMNAALDASLLRLELIKLINILRDLLGVGFNPLELGLPSPAGAADAVLAEFARAKLSKGEHAYLLFPAELLQQRLPQSNCVTLRSAARICDEMMNKLFFEPVLIRQVKKQLGGLDAGVPTLTDIARRLRMSERTLRRRLRDLDTSYQRIIQDVRLEMAKSLLSDRSISTQRISENLGYAEPGNFRNAFKRWTGASPQRFRAALPA